MTSNDFVLAIIATVAHGIFLELLYRFMTWISQMEAIAETLASEAGLEKR